MTRLKNWRYRFDTMEDVAKFEEKLQDSQQDGIAMKKEKRCVTVYYVDTSVRTAMRMLEMLNQIAAQCGYGGYLC